MRSPRPGEGRSLGASSQRARAAEMSGKLWEVARTGDADAVGALLYSNGIYRSGRLAPVSTVYNLLVGVGTDTTIAPHDSSPRNQTAHVPPATTNPPCPAAS